MGRFSPGFFGWFAGLATGGLLAWLAPHAPLHATATDRVESYAVATGFCDESIEAVYFLDFLSGDLRAAVLSKQTGKFNAFFARDIRADLGIESGRNPRYLLTTGTADLRRTGGKGLSPSRSIVYVAEVTSGKVAAYSIPWSSAGWVAGQRMSGEILLMDITRFRSPAVATAAAQ